MISTDNCCCVYPIIVVLVQSTCECIPSIPIILNLHFSISVSDKTSHFLQTICIYISIPFQTVEFVLVDTFELLFVLTNEDKFSRLESFREKNWWVNAFQGRCIESLTGVSFEASRSIFERKIWKIRKYSLLVNYGTRHFKGDSNHLETIWIMVNLYMNNMFVWKLYESFVLISFINSLGKLGTVFNNHEFEFVPKLIST